MECMCALGLYSHPNGKIPSTGGSEEVGTRDAAITQDSEPYTLPTELFPAPLCYV